MNIILLEPDRVLADTYRQALMNAGHSVTMCASAQAAIFAADECQPNLVILELQLIGHSGLEFLYEFRSYEDWRTVPAIVLTSVPAGEFSGSWDILKNELVVSAYHYKPLTSLRTLLRSVDSLKASVVLAQAGI